MSTVAVATLRERTALWEFIDGRDRFERDLKQAGHDVVRFNVRATYLSRGRRECVEHFLEDPNLDWLLFLDSDVVAPTRTGVRLLEWDRPIVSGLYVRKAPPYLPEAYRWDGEFFQPIARELLDRFRRIGVGTVPGLLEAPAGMPVDGVGAGCLLIRRDVLEKLGPACFGPTESPLSEDLFFCRRAAEAGIKIWLDYSVICGHLTVMPVTLAHLLMINENIERLNHGHN